MSGGVFEQHFHASVENVYNINGDLILSRDSSAVDVARELTALRQQVAQQTDMDPRAREVSVQAVVAALEESKKPNPNGIAIQKHLGTAASTIEKCHGIADKGLKLAKTLFSIGQWVGSFL